MTNTRQDVPTSDVGRIVQHYVDDGATKVVAKPEANGTWTVTATYP